MNRYNQPSPYITQIIQAQNKLRSKLPYILEYNASKHFDYLSNNKDHIQQYNLQNLIPFQNQYKQFNPITYLDQVIWRINSGEHLLGGVTKNNGVEELKKNGVDNKKRQGLGFRGYMRLINTQRLCASGRSQVNTTLINRLTLSHEIQQKLQTNEKSNKKADLIIGMLLFLQCLKIAQQNNQINSKVQQKVNIIIQDKTIKKQYKNNTNLYNQNNQKTKYQFRPSTYQKMIPISQSPRFQTPKTKNRKPIFSLESASRSKLPSNLNNQYYQNNTSRYLSPYVPIKYTHQSRTKQTRMHTNPQQHQHLYPYNQQNKYRFLQKFENEQNVWKNISTRNWDHKNQLNKKSNFRSSAFIYQDVDQSKSVYFRNLDNRTPIKIRNFTQRYYH